MVWFGVVWYGVVWYGMKGCGVVRCGMVWYGMDHLLNNSDMCGPIVMHILQLLDNYDTFSITKSY